MRTTGGPSDARAAIRAEIDAAAPRPLPTDLALALLRELEEADVAVLGALAYEALTGAAPGDDPIPPVDLVPGFPPFASEALMRAMRGQEDRRPTAHTLLVALETVPASAWPAPAEPVGEEPVSEEPEPLGGAGDLPPPTTRPHRSRRSARRARTQHPQAPPQVTVVPEPSIAVRGEPDAEPDAERKPARGERRRRQREERRDANRQTERKPKPRRQKDAVRTPADEARDQTLVMVGVLIVLIVLGALYATNRDEPATSEPPPAEGASRTAFLTPG